MTGNFHDQRRDAALALIEQQNDLRRRVAEIALGDAARRHDTYRVTDVISLDPDSHVAEITENRSGNITWTTVCFDGVQDRTHFFSVDLAMLHLIARRHGAKSDMGVAAGYAARVLAIPEA